MVKFFLLIVMAWLVGIPGSGGLILLLGFFLFCAYSIRYRGYHGRLSGEEQRSLRLSRDVDTHSMREQWDVIPWQGTSKHVIRKWTWDKIALDERIQSKLETVNSALSKVNKNLGEFALKKQGTRSATRSNPYSQTLAVVDPDHTMAHTPTTALALLDKVMEKDKAWTNQAICTLGGTLIICAEAFKGDVKTWFSEQGKKEPRMAFGTVEETSRMTWKAGQLFLNPGTTSILKFVEALVSRINPWDKHAVIKYQDRDYYAPTTMFGASATIMKVMNLCTMLGLSDEEKLCVTYAVAMHWIDKYLNDNTWLCGGTFTPDRHSLLEALQGAYAHIEGNPRQAALALAQMYEEADEARLKLEDKKKD